MNKTKRRSFVAALFALICAFVLVFSLGMMSACGNESADTAQSAGGAWYYGTAIPSDTLGENGDHYLNTETLTSYVKESNVWRSAAPGEAGKWYYGTEEPGEFGTAGDFYLKTDTSDLYQKGAEDWEHVCTLKGNDGRDGVIWFSGKGHPDTSLDLAGKVKKQGDFYIDTDTWTVYQLGTEDKWVELGSIKGQTPQRGTAWFYGTVAPEDAALEDVYEGDFYYRTYIDDVAHTENYRIYRYESGAWAVKTTVMVQKIDDALFGADNEEYFKDNGTTVVVEKAAAGATELTIPGQLEGKPVEIKEEAFKGNKTLESVTIEEGVTEIPAGMCDGCGSLTTVTIPESVTSIGDNAFRYTAVDNVVIPAGVESIGAEAFRGGVLRTDEPSHLTSVTFEPNGNLKEIGEFAFSYCKKLEDIELPEGLVSIRASAFAACEALDNVVIPESVTELGSRAFSSCSALTSISFAPGTQIDRIPDYFVSQCEQLTSFEIPESVTVIGVSAFGNSGLESIAIPANVKTIESRAFCTNISGKVSKLASVTFAPESKLEEIGDMVFWGTLIETIEIPASVLKVGEQAFKNASLSSVTFADGSRCVEIGAGCFADCANLASLEIPTSVQHISTGILNNTAIYNTEDNWTKISDGKGVEKWTCLVVDGCLISMKKLGDTVPDLTNPMTGTSELRKALVESGEYTVKLPEGLRLIAESFSNSGSGSDTTKKDATKSYAKVIIPYTVEYICDFAFGSGTDPNLRPGKVVYLSEIEIEDTEEHPSVLKSIGAYAFSSYSVKIDKMNIPDSVEHIGTNAFTVIVERSYNFATGLECENSRETVRGDGYNIYNYVMIIHPDNYKISVDGWYAEGVSVEQMQQYHPGCEEKAEHNFYYWYNGEKGSETVTEFWYSLYSGIELWRDKH